MGHSVHPDEGLPIKGTGTLSGLAPFGIEAVAPLAVPVPFDDLWIRNRDWIGGDPAVLWVQHLGLKHSSQPVPHFVPLAADPEAGLLALDVAVNGGRKGRSSLHPVPPDRRIGIAESCVVLACGSGRRDDVNRELQFPLPNHLDVAGDGALEETFHALHGFPVDGVAQIAHPVIRPG